MRSISTRPIPTPVPHLSRSCDLFLRLGRWLAAFPVFFTALPLLAGSPALDLSGAVVFTPAVLTMQEGNAVRMLVEEVEKRTRLRWPVTSTWPVTNASVIAVGEASALASLAGPFAVESSGAKAEGYRLRSRPGLGRQEVFVIGHDSRGVLFGVGRLLRELHMGKGSATLAGDLDVTTAPRDAVRGHQLGYRPKCNSYDAWDLPVWEQYFRDLAVFGCNTVELIPPRSDDDADSPHFPRPQMEMMTGMSRLADDYGLDVSIWYPAMDPDYSNPKTVEFALKEWAGVFRRLPRIDVVFVPGGDPGHTRPKYLMALLEKQAESLHRYHPKAQMWVSPQSFTQPWLEEFIEILRRDQPAWLGGIVFGPQTRVGLPRLRELVPARYPIRHYPDITHSRQSQYPVPNWDTAYAVTEARECVNPRPEDEAVIFRQANPYTTGFVTYSEGCNDDVNKCVWSALGWDPDAKVTDILRDYSRYYIADRHADSFAQGLLALERNWRGPLLANEGVETTLEQFRSLEKSASPADLKNWRFQQALLRAYYDAYVRRRLIHETDLEARAMEKLRDASALGAVPAMTAAEEILDRAAGERVAEAWRVRILQLGEALFQSIGMQLSVDKYQAIAMDRGACLDTMDFPLNDRPWLKERFRKIRQLKTEAERLKAIDEVTEWTNPGPGGFYDDLGDSSRQPHLVAGPGFAADPGFLESPRVGFEEDLVWDDPEDKPDGARRKAWVNHAETLYDTPLRMKYQGLDPQARYKLRVVYAGDSRMRKIRLTVNDGIPIHPLMVKPFPFKPVEFDIPPSATAGGELTLQWFGVPGLGGNGRGCQVSEVWLVKEKAARDGSR